MTKLPADIESRDVGTLTSAMGAKVADLLAACAKKNLKVVPYSCRRGPATQARLWCRSRTLEEVSVRRQLMFGAGAPTLASLLKDEWASLGRWSTNALPGQSWHQWGEACDCYIDVGGKAIWVSSQYDLVYGAIAKALGLTSGALWLKNKDPGHVQLRSGTPNSMGAGLSWAEIEQEMLSQYNLVTILESVPNGLENTGI